MRGPSGHARRLLGAAVLALVASAWLAPPPLRPLALALAVPAAFAFGRATSARHAPRARSSTDRLTGLRTPDSFSESLAMELARVRRYGGCVSLVLVELDGLGTSRLMGSVGRVLSRETRDADIAARVGDTQLALVVPGRAEQAAAAAERMRHAIADIPGAADFVTASAGVATFPVDARDAEELFEQARDALSKARRQARSRVVGASDVRPPARAAG
jgi:diguanylate cyclase (GGDEF)-like protein